MQIVVPVKTNAGVRVCVDVVRTNDSLPCGGPARGQCVCGKCECNPVLVSATDSSQRFSGKYCQCNDYSCDRFESMLCGGQPADSLCLHCLLFTVAAMFLKIGLT